MESRPSAAPGTERPQLSCKQPTPRPTHRGLARPPAALTSGKAELLWVSRSPTQTEGQELADLDTQGQSSLTACSRCLINVGGVSERLVPLPPTGLCCPTVGVTLGCSTSPLWTRQGSPGGLRCQAVGWQHGVGALLVPHGYGVTSRPRAGPLLTPSLPVLLGRAEAVVSRQRPPPIPKKPAPGTRQAPSLTCTR